MSWVRGRTRAGEDEPHQQVLLKHNYLGAIGERGQRSQADLIASLPSSRRLVDLELEDPLVVDRLIDC